jgi:hypothetical protein
MLRRELLVRFAQRKRLGRLDEATGALGVFFEIHETTPLRPAPNAQQARSGHR